MQIEIVYTVTVASADIDCTVTAEVEQDQDIDIKYITVNGVAVPQWFFNALIDDADLDDTLWEEYDSQKADEA